MSTDVRAVVSDHVERWAALEAAADERGETRVPQDTLSAVRRSGLLAAPLPHDLDGWDASLAQTAEAVRIVARHAPSTALALAMPLGNAATTRIPASVVPAAARPALAEGRAWIAERVHAGRLLAVANSEPGAGGDLAQTRTAARRRDDGVYLLTGKKAFATLGPDADYFLCAARKDGAAGAAGVDGFFVARDAPGLRVGDDWQGLGMRTTASVGLELQDAPAAALLGYPGCLTGTSARHWSTVLFSAVFVGLAEGALDVAVQHAGKDSAWARATLADTALSIDAAAGLVEAVSHDEPWPFPAARQERARRAKTFAARIAVEAATRAAILGGGRSYREHHPIARLLRDALAAPLLRPPLPAAMDAIADELFAARV